MFDQKSAKSEIDILDISVNKDEQQRLQKTF